MTARPESGIEVPATTFWAKARVDRQTRAVRNRRKRIQGTPERNDRDQDHIKGYMGVIGYVEVGL
jgi:hypothetical protein